MVCSSLRLCHTCLVLAQITVTAYRVHSGLSSQYLRWYCMQRWRPGRPLLSVISPSHSLGNIQTSWCHCNLLGGHFPTISQVGLRPNASSPHCYTHALCCENTFLLIFHFNKKKYILLCLSWNTSHGGLLTTWDFKNVSPTPKLWLHLPKSLNMTFKWLFILAGQFYPFNKYYLIYTSSLLPSGRNDAHCGHLNLKPSSLRLPTPEIMTHNPHGWICHSLRPSA